MDPKDYGRQPFELHVTERATEIARDAISAWAALDFAGRAFLYLDAKGRLQQKSPDEAKEWVDEYLQIQSEAQVVMNDWDARALVERAFTPTYDEKSERIITPTPDSVREYVRSQMIQSGRETS